VFGGFFNDASGSRILSNVDTYDPSAPVGSRWTPRSSLGTPRYSAIALTGVDGLIYVMGGATAPPTPGAVAVYDPAQDLWLQ
jgi:hypothetical protein